MLYIRFSLTRAVSQGIAAIELAMALPVLALFILGAVDISRSMHAYSALQEGVRTGLRCTYTTDGDCVHAAPGSRTAFFHWNRVLGERMASIAEIMPAGELRWIGAPRRYATAAEVLQNVHYAGQQRSFRFQDIEYRVQQAVAVVVAKAQFPYVHGSNARNPLFGYRNAPSRNAPNNNNWGNKFVWNAPNTAEFVIDSDTASVSATINNLDITPFAEFGSGGLRVPKNTLCYKSPQFDSSGSHAPITDFNGVYCDATFGKRRVVVHVRGDASGSGHGSIGLELNGDGYGGQAMDGNSGNFYPRGIPNQDYRQNSAIFQTQEFANHTSVTLAEDGNGGLQLEVRIVRIGQVVNPSTTPTPTPAPGSPTWSSSLSWRLTGVDIYLPEYELQVVPKEQVNCTEYTRLSRFGSNANPRASCSPAAPLDRAHPIGNPSPHLSESRLGVNPVSVCGLTESVAQAAVQPAEDYVTEGIDEGPGSCGIAHTSSACPLIGTRQGTGAINYGVTANPTIVGTGPASEKRIPAGNTEAAAICPPPSGATVDYWTVADQNLPASAAYDITQVDCAQPIVIPGEALNYKHRYDHIVTVEIAGSSSTVNPWTEPRFSCGDMQHRSAVFDARLSPTEPGIYPEVVALPVNSPWRAGYDDQTPECLAATTRPFAEQTFPQDRHPGLNPAALYFQVNGSTLLRTRRLEGGCEAGQQNSCLLFNCQQTPTGMERLTAEPLPAGQKPAACDISGTICSSEFSHFVGEAGTITRDLERAARDQAFAQIQSMYPQADYGCQGSNCVQVAYADSGSTIRGQGRIEVPLNLLMGRKIELSFTEQREIEQTFAR